MNSTTRKVPGPTDPNADRLGGIRMHTHQNPAASFPIQDFSKTVRMYLIVLAVILLGLVAWACAHGQTQMTTEAGDLTAQVDSGFYVPQGDPHAGREVFKDMRCYACHRVIGEDFPKPIASPPVPVALGPSQAKQTRAQLAESILAPSHRIPENLPDVRGSGEFSRMGDFNEYLTVRELIDLVSYVQFLDGAPEGHQNL